MDNTYVKGTVVMHQPIPSLNILLSFIPPPNPAGWATQMHLTFDCQGREFELGGVGCYVFPAEHTCFIF